MPPSGWLCAHRVRVAATRFIRSAAGPSAFPADGRPEIALAGRSNVGKSSLVNALVRQPVARTSATPGKTRLVNLYLVEPSRRGSSFYLVDLPGYGHAGGGEEAAAGFDRLVRAYFGRRHSSSGDQAAPVRQRPRRIAGVILVLDARHPGLDKDRAAFEWLRAQRVPVAIAATKVDKLSQAERARLPGQLERTFGCAAFVVSAATGEGLERLWRHLLAWITLP